jgi:hypothetical protein
MTEGKTKRWKESKKKQSKNITKLNPTSLLGVSAGLCLRDVLDESEMFGTHAGTHSRSKMAAVHGKLCTAPPRNKNQ